MMDTPITRAEHEEFRRRLEEENKRQDKRIEILEVNTQQIASLTTSIEKLAVSIKGMVKEQEYQNERLATLEARDGELWRAVVKHAITAIVGIFVGYIFTQIGL